MAADEAAALSNIHGLLDLLESQRQSVLGSLDATEVGCSFTASPCVCNIQDTALHMASLQGEIRDERTQSQLAA